MATKTTKNNSTDKEIFDALSKAEKLLENYSELVRIAALNDYYILHEEYHRDINHPLSIVLKQ